MLLSGLSSVGAYACLRGSSDTAVGWLATGSAMLTILPFTFIFIKPVNAQLIDTEKCVNVRGKNIYFIAIYYIILAHNLNLRFMSMTKTAKVLF